MSGLEIYCQHCAACSGVTCSGCRLQCARVRRRGRMIESLQLISAVRRQCRYRIDTGRYTDSRTLSQLPPAAGWAGDTWHVTTVTRLRRQSACDFSLCDWQKYAAIKFLFIWFDDQYSYYYYYHLLLWSHSFNRPKVCTYCMNSVPWTLTSITSFVKIHSWMDS